MPSAVSQMASSRNRQLHAPIPRLNIPSKPAACRLPPFPGGALSFFSRPFPPRPREGQKKRTSNNNDNNNTAFVPPEAELPGWLRVMYDKANKKNREKGGKTERREF